MVILLYSGSSGPNQNSSLTHDVQTCVRIFPLVGCSSSFCTTPCGNATSDFVSENNCLSIHSSALRGGNLYCWLAVTGGGKRCLNMSFDCGLIAPCVARARRRPKGESHPQHGKYIGHNYCFYFPFTSRQVLVVSGSVVFQDLSDAFVDVCPIERLSNNKSRVSVTALAPAMSAVMAVHTFLRYCIFQ